MNARCSLFRPSPRLGRLLIAVAPLFFSVTTRAETNFTVLAMTNVWRYNETTNVDGTGWQQPGYDDSAWAAGPGMFGFDDNLNVIPLIRTLLGNPITYRPSGHCVYFRTRFNLPGDPRGAILTLTNRLDDGAVFYLNGAQLTRVRVTANPALFTSPASGLSGDATADEIVTLIPTNLVAGENLLAVSLHNGDSLSSDLVFGCAVSAFIPDAIVITNQPQSQTVALSSSATFAAGVSGSLPTYQWQFKNSNITGATNATYTIPFVSTNSAGDYRVIIANTVNRATSAVATLTVIEDHTPPTLISAVASETTNWIIVTFSESVRALNATNIVNYRITLLGSTDQIVITNALVMNNLVRLRNASPWTAGNNYVLTVNNVEDVYTNTIAPNSRIGIAMWREVVSTNTQWNWSEGFDLSGQNWAAVNYNEFTNDYRNGGQWKIPDPAWETIGRGLFYFYGFYFNGFIPSPKNTVLKVGSPTFYFRTSFVLPEGFKAPGALALSYAVDDGAVFYLNGAELHRYNMPGGSPGYRTRAASERGSGGAPWATASGLAVTNLVTGTNILAVELHPYTTDPQDYYGICFGAGLRAALAPDPDASPAGLMLTPRSGAPAPSAPTLSSAPIEVAAAGGISNVVHISIDGGAGYWIESYVNTAPNVFSNFHRLQTEGAITYNARCDAYSATIPNHFSMLTGRPVEQPTNMANTIHHGYLPDVCATIDDGNTIHNAGNTNAPYKASVFDVVHDHGLSTGFLFGKAASLSICERSYNAKYGGPDLIPPDNGPNKIDYSVGADSYADQLVSLFVQDVKFLPAKRYTFLHFADPDKVGHRWGWGSSEWSNSIVNLDEQIGRILDAIQNDPMLSNHTVIIVTADHGGAGNGHWMGNGTKVFQIPLLLWGSGIPAGVDLYSLFSNRADPGTNWLDYSASSQPLRNADTGNLALNLLGLPPIPGSLMIPKFAWDEPSLALQTTSAALLVSWSGYATNFQLEASASLDSSATWNPVTEDITQADGRFTHPANASSGENRFYRLRKVTP